MSYVFLSVACTRKVSLVLVCVHVLARDTDSHRRCAITKEHLLQKQMPTTLQPQASLVAGGNCRGEKAFGGLGDLPCKKDFVQRTRVSV